ncbi:MAG: carbohydrate kinase family protein [Clostridia bacterium]|nr:carbohydrate kinase family protein [Clostridia bacterium]MBQ9480576.1 carbohydrate kinase family protein [Clostridia bacterium]
MIERKGIMLAGNILTDTVKMIPSYPEKGMLVTITDIKRGVGGSVPNSGMDLKMMDPSLEVFAAGRVGDDDNGRYVVGRMAEVGMDVSGVKHAKNGTSFSDVMTVSSTGERTFFHYRGANAEFDITDVDADKITAKMFHLGYLLLLDKVEEKDGEYGNRAARLLAEVQKRGVKTSIDVVSESSGHFAEVVVPTLKFCNYAIMNEIEACQISGNTPRDKNGDLDEEEVKAAMRFIAGKGVKDAVIVHAPEKGFVLRSDGKFTSSRSLSLPKGYIKGSVGAGDAFCAGCLYGLYNGWNDEEILKFSAAAAACNLAEADSVSGMKTAAEIWKIYDKYKKD